MEIETYSALKFPGLRHGFSTRSALPLEQLEADLEVSFAAAGFDLRCSAQGTQPHGAEIAAVREVPAQRIAEVDALATDIVGLTLIVRVADCGPVYFYDPIRRVIAVAHSGRRGTEANITGATIDFLQKTYGTRPEDLHVHLGPCIRPPHYEVDFAAEIAKQAQKAGVLFFTDDQLCTACHLTRYYSYRAEKGQTGRMWAAVQLTNLA